MQHFDSKSTCKAAVGLLTIECLALFGHLVVRRFDTSFGDHCDLGFDQDSPDAGENRTSETISFLRAAVVEAKQVAKVLVGIPDAFTKPLLLVALGGSYKDAAAECGCEVGTVKSRVNGARAKLLSALAQTTRDPGVVRRLVDL